MELPRLQSYPVSTTFQRWISEDEKSNTEVLI